MSTLRLDWTSPSAAHLVDGYIVARSLEARGVVVAIPHHNADFMQDDRADQLVGTLDLHYDGLDRGGGL